MRFTAELESGGGNTAGFRVPEEVVAALAGGKRPKVTVTLNGYTYRTSVAPMGGDYWVGVAIVHREPAGVEPGHTYEVDLELDTAPRVVELPAELTEAFAAEPALADAWAAMSYSNQRRLAEPIGAAKGEDTRARRIAKAIAELPSVTREHSPLTLPSPCERPSRDEIARGARDRTPAGAISNRTCDLVPSGDRLRFRLVPCSRSP